MSTATWRRSERVRLLVGVTLAVALLTLLALSLDVAAISAALAGTDWRLVALAGGAALSAQLCLNLLTVWILRSADDSLPWPGLLVAAFSGTFGKLVLPLGNLGGAAILTYAVSEGLEARFRDVFPAVTAGELLRFGSSLAVATLGLAGLAARPVAGVEGPAVLVLLSAILVGLFAGGITVTYRRDGLGLLIEQFAALLRRVVGRFSNRISRRLEADRVAASVAAFLDTFDRATADTGRLVVAGTLGVTGWVAFGLALYLSFAAVGVSVPLALALFVAPASGLATLLPTPGGLGSSEVALTAAFVFLGVASPELAAASVLLYRFVSYWLVVAVGGLASLSLSMAVWGALE